MAANDPVTGFLGGMFIVAEGMITLPYVILNAIDAAVTSYFLDAKPADFDAFFKNALGFEELEAKNITFRYLTSAWTFNFAPGLGGARASQQFGGISSSELDGEFRRLLIGKPTNNAGVTGWELRLGDYLKAHKTALAAKGGLTPAKRDALRAEAKKLLAIPAAAFVRRYRKDSRFSAIGVRG